MDHLTIIPPCESEPAALHQQIHALEQRLLERDQLIAELRAQECKLNDLLDLSYDWVWEVDAQAVYTFVGARVQDFLGYEPAEVLGKTPFDFMPPDEARRVGAAFGPIVAAQQPFRGLVNVNLHKNGARVILETSGIPLFDKSGAFRGYCGVDCDITEREQAAAERARLQEDIIRGQAATLAELSTPLIPITDTVMVMPLIGTVDSRRAQQVIETLLNGIAASRAVTAILDITGVPVVDTQVANALLRAAQAVKLLGAQVVLSGIRPEVAQTLTGLGVDLGGIITSSSLQRSVAYALGQR